MQSRRERRALVRFGTFAAALGLLAGAAPAAATEPPGRTGADAPRTAPARGGRGGGLLLLSFLVPLPLPMALVAPVSTRPAPAGPPPAAEVQPRSAPPDDPRKATARR